MESLFRLATLRSNIENEMLGFCRWLEDKVIDVTEVPDSRSFFKCDISTPCTATINRIIDGPISRMRSPSDAGDVDDVVMGDLQEDPEPDNMDVDDGAHGHQEGENVDIPNDNEGRHDDAQDMRCGDEEPDVVRHPEDKDTDDQDTFHNGGSKQRSMRKGDEDEGLSEGLSELTTETGSEVVTGENNGEEDEEEQYEEEEDDVEEEDGVLLRRSSARVKNTSVYSTQSTQSTKPSMKARRGREVVDGKNNREEDEEEQDEEEEDDVEEEDGVLLRRSSARVKNTSVYSTQSTQSTKPRMKARRGSEVVTGQNNREEDEEEQYEEEEDDVEEEDGVLLRRSSARVKNTSVYSTQSMKPRMK